MSDVIFKIVLTQPPAGVAIGLQQGKGHDYETVQTQQGDGGDLVFEFSAVAKPGADFSGPFVQGKKGERFVYLDIGTAAGQHGSPWTRRLKIPLTGVTAAMVAAGRLETAIPGTGRDGGPSCGTSREFDGWQITGRPPKPGK